MASKMPVFARFPASWLMEIAPPVARFASVPPGNPTCGRSLVPPRLSLAAPTARGGAGQGKARRERPGLAHKANGLVGSWLQLGLLLKGDKQLPRRGEAA